MFKNLKKNNLSVISHDAGGANQIYYFLKYKKIQFNLYARGPAKKIFKKKNYTNNLKKLINKSEIILFGSGTGTLEYKILQKSILCKKYTIVFLENWVNFKERIARTSKSLLPNEIWVSDEIAYYLAKKYFKNLIKIKKIQNYYLKSFTKKTKKLIKKNKIIYLSPNYDLAGVTNKYRKKKDLKIFEIFLSKMKILNKIIKQKKLFIDLLLHPSEDESKYNNFKKKYPKLITILFKKNLKNVLFNYKYAVSTNSYALFVSKKIGLITFNNIKKTGIKKSIPSNYIDYDI
jgi:hypothetical protein